MKIDHERRDVNVGVLFWLAALFVLAGLITVLVVGGLFRYLTLEHDRQNPVPSALATERVEFPLPRLQVSPPADLEKFRAEEERELHNYAWIDRAQGVVRLPIDRAIELLAARGLPEVGQGKTPLQFQQKVPVQNDHRAR